MASIQILFRNNICSCVGMGESFLSFLMMVKHNFLSLQLSYSPEQTQPGPVVSSDYNNLSETNLSDYLMPAADLVCRTPPASPPSFTCFPQSSFSTKISDHIHF